MSIEVQVGGLVVSRFFNHLRCAHDEIAIYADGDHGRWVGGRTSETEETHSKDMYYDVWWLCKRSGLAL